MIDDFVFISLCLKVLQELAQKHKTSVSAVAIRWVLSQPCVPAAIIGARNARHLVDLQVREIILRPHSHYQGRERQAPHIRENIIDLMVAF
jgi:predicted oxidoreductase